MEYVIRFLLGGLIVSIFAVIGDLFRPRTFSGIFGAAPTVALATLGLAFSKDSISKISTEGRSMIIGGVALMVYSLVTAFILLKRKWPSLPAAALAYVVWFAVALGLYALVLR